VLLALGLRWLVVPALLLSTAIGVLIHGLLPSFGYQDVWDWYLFSPFQFGFAAGALIYQYREKLAMAGNTLPLVFGAALGPLCAVVIEPYQTGAVWTAGGAYLLIEVFGYTTAFSLVVIGMLNLERRGALESRARLVDLLVFVGDSSYVLYLFNYLFMPSGRLSRRYISRQICCGCTWPAPLWRALQEPCCSI
jgi:peptidoglycan/LPS O-acetylase OafA/YrhL